MLLANRRASRFTQDTSVRGYSKPAPGLLILVLSFLRSSISAPMLHLYNSAMGDKR